MQRNATPSSVWHRRTNRMIAAAVIVIGLTMMISNITQCIYIGMLFIVIALVWLAWLTMKERKLEPPRPEDQPSPVLFLVTSHILPRTNRPTVANPTDKPPSYDQIVSLDGLPPDYSSVMPDKPPQYEELSNLQLSFSAIKRALPGPSYVVYSGVDGNATNVHRDNKNTATVHCSNERVDRSSPKCNTASIDGDEGVEAVPSNGRNLIPMGNSGGDGTSSSLSLRRQPKSTVAVTRTRKRHNSFGGCDRATTFQSAGNLTNSSTVGVHNAAHVLNSSNITNLNSPLRIDVSTLQQDIEDNASTSLTIPDSLQNVDSASSSAEKSFGTEAQIDGETVSVHIVDDDQLGITITELPMYRSTPV